MSSNHFITVSKQGVLLARRKGSAPVRIAEAANGLEVVPDAEAVGRHVPSPLRVRFGPGGGNPQIRVTEIAFADEWLEVSAFQQRFSVTDEQLGGWMRTAVEKFLDAT